MSDPLTRFATATTILLRDLAAQPARARLAARAAADMPGVSQAVHVRMREDLAAALAAGCLALPSSDLAARIVSAIFLQAVRDLGLGWIDARTVPHIVGAVLRAIGCTPDDAAARTAEAARNADKFAHQLAAAGEADLPGGQARLLAVQPALPDAPPTNGSGTRTSGVQQPRADRRRRSAERNDRF
jgi:hypothetical protein